ncbi:outer membrane beta-barrel protein [Phocaeicola sp.]
MRKVILLLGLLLNVIIVSAQNISGTLVGEDGAPISFANVVLLSSRDSAFVQGTISNEQGAFSIAEAGGNNILRISCLGFVTVTQAYTRYPVTIVMHEDANMMEEVVVNGHRPAYKLTSEGLQTNVQGTVLSKMGTADDVLKHIPGLQKKNGGYEVFGKGSPIIYVNGRLLRDLSELDQLKSEDIKNVELITSPGVKYDATVKAVVKITTKPIKGEGFGFDVRSGYNQWEYAGFVEQLNWNYRRNKLDIFGTVYYRKSEGYSESWFTQDTRVDTLWHQNNYQFAKTDVSNFTNIVGVNYAFDENNSIGAKYTLKANPDGKYHTIFNTDMYADGEYYDYLANDLNATAYYNPSHLVNVYYKGKISETEIDFNADYLFDKSSDNTVQNEKSSNKEDRLVTSTNKLRNELFAAKLVLSHPLFGGNVVAGAEYTHTEREDDYINPEGYVPTSFSKLKEQNISPFLEYNRDTPIGQLSVGTRYEWVNFDYYEDGKYMDGQSRSFGNFFPSISLGSEIGKVQLQLSYSAKTRRPSYQQLSNNVTYANRFTLQSGNPRLKHEIIHNVSLMGAWQFMQFSLGYTDRRDAIIYWGEQVEDNPATTLISFKNLNSLKSVSAFMSLAPKFGIWAPQLSFGVQKQWLDLETSTGILRMNKPLFTGAFNNTFNFNHGWVVSAEMNYQSKGDMENCSETKNVFYVDAGITKFFFNDKLSVKLSGTDLFHGMKSGNRMYYNKASSLQISQYDSRQVMFTVRYKFNATRNKYKGSGAGESEKERL